MKAITHIRTNVFKQTQREFGLLAGVSQGTVSRWERGELHPSHSEMSRIRTAAIRTGMHWDDQWFFVAPASDKPAEVQG